MSVESEGRDRAGVVEGIRIDVRRLYDAWMELIFPRQRYPEHSVLGRWRPRRTRDRVLYRAWGLIGAPLVAVLYPFALLGFAVRFYARRFDSASARLGVVGVVLLAIVVWGALTVATYVRLSTDAVLAVGSASAVAVVSAGLAAFFTRRGGRVTTVLLAYPFGVTALLLPPVVAALYSPTLAEAVFPGSDSLAIWLLDNPLSAFGIGEFLRTNFDLVGVAYVLMWFGIAVPFGWILGLLVTLADVVRPTHANGEPTGAAME